MKFCKWLSIVGLLTACSTTSPVVAISDRDGTLRGTSTASLEGGSFSVSNGKVTCSGSYNAITQAPTIEIVVQCSDGRRGIGSVTRSSARSGSGVVRLNDGSTANLVFGPAAASY